MDCTKSDKTDEMVKLTIKRADCSPDNKEWICERIDENPETVAAEKRANRPNESFPVDAENSYKETDVENRYATVPSYREIEMKEIDHQQPAHSHGTTGSTGNSCSGPIDLSASSSKRKSQKDVTNNVSFEQSIGAHTSKRKFPGDVYADYYNTPSLTGAEGIMQNEAVYQFPRPIASVNTLLDHKQRQLYSREVVAMAMRTMPLTNQNFSMTVHRNSPIYHDFVNSEKPETVEKGYVRNPLQQEAVRHLNTNYGRFSADARNYGTSGNFPNSDANKSYNWTMGFENKDDLRQKHEDYLKRLSQTNVQTGSNNALESVRPSKKKKSDAEVRGTTYICNICNLTYKSYSGYYRHLDSAKHLGNLNNLQQPNLHDFPPNSACRHPGPTVIPTQQQPQQPHLLYSMGNRMWFQQMLQAQAVLAANQSGVGRTVTDNADVRKPHPGTSKSDCSGECLGHSRSQNDLEINSFAQNPNHKNLPVNYTSNPQGIHLHPGNPQIKNSMMANPKYLENRASQSSRSHINPPSEIQPENAIVWPNIAESLPRAIKKIPNQLKNLMVAGSSRKSKRPVPRHQLEIFQVYHCLVCSTFHTDYLQDLELHVSVDRSHTPYELITITDDDFVCKLCDFTTKITEEVGGHFTSQLHVNRVQYYNHVMEGGLKAKEKLNNLHMFTPIYLFCSACEFSARSMDTLKHHSLNPSHRHNVACCFYFAKYNTAVEYCFCRLCSVSTSTVRELLLHVRSNEHMTALQKYPSSERNFCNPAHLFFIKELSVNKIEPLRVAEQTEASALIGREKPNMRKENETRDIAGNPAPVDVDSSSTSSTSLQPLSLSCCLCQKVFPDVKILEQHLQRIHNANEAGAKFLVSKVGESKSLTEDLTDTNAGKLKSTVSSPQKDKKSPVQGISIDSSSCQSSVAAQQDVESKSSACFSGIKFKQNVAIDENLNQKMRTDTDSSSSQNPEKLDQNFGEATVLDFSSCQQLCETERMQNAGRSITDSFASQRFYEKEGRRNSVEPDQNQDFDQGRVRIHFSSRHQFRKKENVLPVGKVLLPNSEENLNSLPSEDVVETYSKPTVNGKDLTVIGGSVSEHFSATNLGLLKSPSRLNVRSERSNSSSSNHNLPLRQQFCKTENILPLGEEDIMNSEKRLIYSSSSADMIVETESEPTGGGKNETETGGSSSDHFSVTEYGWLNSRSDLNARRERKESPSSNHNPPTKQQFSRTENTLLLGEEKVLNSSSSQATVIEYESEPYCDDKYETEDVSLSEQFSETERGSPASPSYLNTSIERTRSDRDSATPERLLAIYDSSVAHVSPISKSDLNASRKRNRSSHDDSVKRKLILRTDSSSSDESSTSSEGSDTESDHNSVTHQRSSSTDDSISEHLASEGGSPVSQSGLKARGERTNSSSSEDIFVEYEWLPERAERNRLCSSPIQRDHLGFKNRKLPLEDQQDSNLRTNLVIDSPINKLTALVRPQRKVGNISTKSENSDDSVNSQMEFYDCPNEYVGELTAPNSPAKIDPLVQANTNIGTIEISNVVSLANRVENCYSSDEEEESMDFECIEFSDQEL